MKLTLGSLRCWWKRRSWRQQWTAAIRPSDLFIVSYPKSGTIWLSFLIANVLNRDPSPLDLRSYRQFIADINPAYFGQESLDRYVRRADPRVFRVHAPFDPMFPTVVYLLRDPRDALVSYWHWHRLNHRDFHVSLAEFIRSEHHWPSAWDKHVSGWVLPKQRPQVLLVKYEELQQDTGLALQRVLEFAGIDYAPEAIPHAVNAARFERMQALEEELVAAGESFGIMHGGQPGYDEERFVRRGRVGGGRSELDAASLQFIEGKYGETMTRLGYQLYSPAGLHQRTAC